MRTNPRIPALVLLVGAALASGLILDGASTRAPHVSGHPNLTAAQKCCSDAYKKLGDAQKVHEVADRGGHLARAKALLDQVSGELKAAVVEGEEDAGK